ncbi:MAG: hypothetical protein OEX23_15470 [Betaproteobacteria bacterium]|jgi:hypothetical protein|nr:hypothetical protein [Betaproteobacteria bacterium]
MGAHPQVDTAADEAIRRVLAAEAEGEASVRAAQREADALRELARAGARAIAARTERRIGTLRRRFEALTQRMAADLDARCAAPATGVADAAVDPQLVARAVAAVAAELTAPEKGGAGR